MELGISSTVLARLHGALDAAEAMSVLIEQIRQSEPLNPRRGRVRRVSELVAEAGELLRSLIRESRGGVRAGG